MTNWPHPPLAKMTNRELADKIDELIRLRIHQSEVAPQSTDERKALDEAAEILVRKIADGLQERDLRQGVHV